MDDLSGAIEQIIRDPAQMEQIFSIAKSLGLNSPMQEDNSDVSVTPDAAVAAAMSSFLTDAGKTDTRQAALLAALKPFLRPERRQSLERAMRVARLTRLARFALEHLNDAK